MCYQYCIKYECPNCVEGYTPDRRTDVLCRPSSRCPLLESRLLPLRIAFRSGPLCQTCRAAQERQQANAQNANQHRRAQHPGDRPRRSAPGPAREQCLDRYRSLHRHRQNLGRERQRYAQEAYTFIPENHLDDHDHQYRYHAAQAHGYARAPPTPSPPQPPFSFFERIYQGSLPRRRPVTPEPAYAYLDRNMRDRTLDESIFRDVDDVFGDAGYDDRSDELLLGMFGCMRFR